LGIGVDGDAARPFQRPQALDDGHQLHAVVGGLAFAAVHGFLVLAGAHQHAPSARAGIALACAVGPHFHLLAVAATF